MTITTTQQIRMRQLIRVIDYFYNEYIGGNENAMQDGNDYYAWTLDELVNEITNEVTNEKAYLRMEGSLGIVEAKHFRFLGKENIRSIVLGRCTRRHNEDKGWLWEK